MCNRLTDEIVMCSPYQKLIWRAITYKAGATALVRLAFSNELELRPCLLCAMIDMSLGVLARGYSELRWICFALSANMLDQINSKNKYAITSKRIYFFVLVSPWVQSSFHLAHSSP